MFALVSSIARDSISESAYPLKRPVAILHHQMDLCQHADQWRLVRSALRTAEIAVLDLEREFLATDRTLRIRTVGVLPLLDTAFRWDRDTAAAVVDWNGVNVHGSGGAGGGGVIGSGSI